MSTLLPNISGLLLIEDISQNVSICENQNGVIAVLLRGFYFCKVVHYG